MLFIIIQVRPEIALGLLQIGICHLKFIPASMHSECADSQAVCAASAVFVVITPAS